MIEYLTKQKGKDQIFNFRSQENRFSLVFFLFEKCILGFLFKKCPRLWINIYISGMCLFVLKSKQFD